MSKQKWTTPKKEDPFKQALDKTLPTEIKRPSSNFNEKEERPETADQKRRAKNELDKLTLSLGMRHYISKPRFAWLVEHIHGVNYPLTVDRWYEPLKLLIDNRVGKGDDKHFELKKKLAEENGFQYFQVKDEETLNEMLAKVRAH